MRHLKLPLIGFAVVAALAAPVSRWSGLSYFATVAILIGAMFANGLIAIIEDDAPGGFNNPDGTATPRYVVVLKWLGRGFVAAAVFGCIALAVVVIRDRA